MVPLGRLTPKPQMHAGRRPEIRFWKTHGPLQLPPFQVSSKPLRPQFAARSNPLSE